MARLTDLYISSDILDTGSTYITGVTSTINSLSTDNEIATAKSIYDASISGITSTQTLEDTLVLGNETNGNDIILTSGDVIEVGSGKINSDFPITDLGPVLSLNTSTPEFRNSLSSTIYGSMSLRGTSAKLAQYTSPNTTYLTATSSSASIYAGISPSDFHYISTNTDGCEIYSTLPIRLVGAAPTTYVGSLDHTNITANRDWTLPDATGTIALTGDIVQPDLAAVLVSGNTTNGNDIDVSIGDRINLYSSDYDSYLSASELYIGGTTDPWSIKINPEEGIEYSSSSSRKLTILTTKTDYYNGTYHKYIEDGDLTATRTIEYPDASGTLALTSDVTTASVWEVGSGIKSVQTSGTGCVASNTYSSASGEDTEATGRASHSEGEETLASGRGSHAEGRNTTASNSYTHAEGEYTEASGLDSHAEGYGTVAFGPQSHAEGRNTTASGDQSHAQGQHTEASGRGSHAGGVGTTSSYKVVASGNVSFNHSSNGLPSTAVGATGHYTAILGGRDNSATGQGTAVIGCNGVTGTQDYTTYMDVMKLTELSAQPTSPEVGTITFYADNLWLYNSTGWYQIT